MDNEQKAIKLSKDGFRRWSKGKYGAQEILEKSRELLWIKQPEVCVVVSSEQNEIQKFQHWDLDIEPLREKMNDQDLEKRFKDENDPIELSSLLIHIL